MDFIMTVDAEGNRTLFPNKSNTPKDLLKQDTTIAFEVPTDKDGLMKLLQQLLDQITQRDQGDVNEERIVQSAPEPEKQKSSYTEVSVNFDQAWETFPLARKLHFAALACEDARDAIKPLKVMPNDQSISEPNSPTS